MKELTDEIEREIKVDPPYEEASVLSHLRRLIPPGWEIDRTTQLDLDIYFDGETLPLYRSGATFRIRARRVKPGWSANYKPVPLGDGPYLERREVKTSLSAAESLLFRSGRLPGLAAELAAQAANLDEGEPFIPMVYMVSVRRVYTVRAGKALQNWSNFITLFFDEVTAFDLRGAPTATIAKVVRHRTLDSTDPLPSASFRVLEAEAIGGSFGGEAQALDIVLALREALAAEGAAPTTRNKYTHALALLGDAPRPPAAGEDAHVREVEVTCEIAGESVCGVLQTLEEVARRGFTAAGRPHHCVRIRGRQRVYLYLRPPENIPAGSLYWTDRLIFGRKGARFRGRLSSKCWKISPGERSKYHCGEVEKAKLPEWVALLRERPHVESALVKTQRRYVFHGPDGDGFQVVLDALVPFLPDDPSAVRAPFFHLEVEALGPGDPETVVEALRPLHPGLAAAPMIIDSKKTRAEQPGGGGRDVHFASAAELEQYLDEAQRAAGERLGPLLAALLAKG